MKEFANLDFDRKKRTGFHEVVFCQGKKDDFLVKIFADLYEKNGEVLGTRASEAQAKLIKSHFPNAEYDELSHIIKLQKEEKPLEGNIAVCSAGTADLYVAEEAALTAEFFGSNIIFNFEFSVGDGRPLLTYSLF